MNYVYLLLALAVTVTGAYGYGRWDGHRLERVKWTQRDNDALREANRGLDALHTKIRTLEHKHAADQAALTLRHQKEKARVQANADAVIARLRAGTLVLRDPAPRSNPDRGGAGAAPPGPGPGTYVPEAELSRALSEFLIGLFAEADEVDGELEYCWGVVRKDRGLE